MDLQVQSKFQLHCDFALLQCWQKWVFQIYIGFNSPSLKYTHSSSLSVSVSFSVSPPLFSLSFSLTPSPPPPLLQYPKYTKTYRILLHIPVPSSKSILPLIIFMGTKKPQAEYFFLCSYLETTKSWLYLPTLIVMFLLLHNTVSHYLNCLIFFSLDLIIQTP